MTPENFCYWLRGFLEIGGIRGLTMEQSKVVDEHLDLVFGTRKHSVYYRDDGITLTNDSPPLRGPVPLSNIWSYNFPPGSC